MSRHRKQTSYAHNIRVERGYYMLEWMVDRYVEGSRLRFPTRYAREADETGARRFAKKWGLPAPEQAK